MKKLWTAALGLVVCLSLAACAGEPQAAPPERTNVDTQSPTPAEDPASSPEQGTESPKPADSPETEAPVETEPLQEPDKETEAEATVKDYYMDKNYILRPIGDTGDKKVVLLTFDDGPKEEALLTAMLDTLDRYEAKAIFFINGYRAEKKPELVMLMYDRGQTIGNHSWDHIDLKAESKEKVKQQIEDVQSLVKKITGEAPIFFRPPFGSGGDIVRAEAADEDMLYMTWSNGSRDWVKGYNKPEKVIESVLEQLHPGSNILMHELPWTSEALEELLKTLQDKGYSFLDPARIDTTYSKN
jgi:peptidoglycan/xylan/chitin deacetylase (PgdA/CDA1 family)